MVTPTDDTMTQCAACGKGGDSLKKCTACKVVKYCGVDCQRAHRPTHKMECKKRAAELHDESLFKQPPSQEECPICFLELPSAQHSIAFKSCCGKIICNGCMHAEAKNQSGGRPLCPFCREPKPCSSEEAKKRIERRMELNDTCAICLMGNFYLDGDIHMGITMDKAKAVELFHRAADLGAIDAHHYLAYMYCHGQGVQEDKKKGNHHLEIAAIGGHVQARYNLGIMERKGGNHHRAMKHWIISANAGYDGSLNKVQCGYMMGSVSKDVFEKTLRAHKKSKDELKSEWRDKAAA